MSRKNFRILLVLSWLLVIAGVVVSFLTESSLPPELRAYLERVGDAPPASGEIVLAVVDVAFIILAIVLTVGLFRFRRWARSLLPVSYALGFALLPAHGPYVESGWESALFYVGSSVDGVILALVYFSPLSEVFEMNGDV